MTKIAPLFNPAPIVNAVPLRGGQSCLVVDNALINPERFIKFAADNRALFEEAPFNAYPGIQMPLPDVVSERLNEFFMLHIRRYLDARRVLYMHGRLAMVTTPPDKLQPRQRICHRDSQEVAPGNLIAASVLYLFKDPALGGTSFYAPKKSAHETALLVHDSSTMSNEDFNKKYGIGPEYFSGLAPWFEKLGSIPAKWNRMIFYDGNMFHSGDIPSPQRLTDDPNTGRLSMNGFFTCSRKAA
jgi:hypothetical protein